MQALTNHRLWIMSRMGEVDRLGVELSHGNADGTARKNSIAIYCGIPFCKTICTYCDFNVYAQRDALFEPYVQALTREIQRTARELPERPRARSLAFGGGTPSILSANQISRIVRTAHFCFEIEPDAEITLEANPGTVDLEKLRALKQMGVTRLSLGVQAFDDARLRSFNRHHRVAESREAFALARRAGFDNINLDLIFGLPDQTLEDWAQTLEQALAMQPEHLSLYGLQVEEGTLLATQVTQGKVSEPDADLAADMYTYSEARLAEAGFEHYEISNWAKPGYVSRHNSTYWLNQPYLGFGAGAHSYFGGARFSNVLRPGEYIARLQRGESVVATREIIGPELEMGETMMLGLRRVQGGVEHSRFEQRFGIPLMAVYERELRELRDWGLVETDTECVRLTPRGRLVSNQVLWRFLPDRAD